MKKIILMLCGVCGYIGATAQVTLSECQRLARENYPLIKQYSLIEASTNYSISNAGKSYLPQISLSGQATYQSDVMAFPEEMSAMFSQMGLEMSGLNKDQYRVGIDISQHIWDGGRSNSQQKIHEAEGAVAMQQIEVESYSIRRKVNTLYFGILILEEQLFQNKVLQELLESNYNKIATLIENGVAMQSDADAIRVEILSTQQQRVQMNATSVAYRQMLALFTGEQSLLQEVLLKPDATMVTTKEIKRAELQLFDSQYLSIEAQKQLSNSSTRPTFKAFASGFYGNPGLNYFEDMISDQFTWNYMVGVKMQWNFGEYYTKKNKLRKLSIAQQQVNNRRELFLFNTSLQTTQEQQAIDKMQQIMRGDEQIIELRTSIRKAAEAKLQNGVVDVNDLLREITAENVAKATKMVHEIELLKNIYDLKNTTNN